MDNNNSTSNANSRQLASGFCDSTLSSLPGHLEQRLTGAWRPEAWRNTHVVLAVSGGADSVALMRAMIAIKAGCGGTGKLFVAHLNHGLRGVVADEDAAWLANVCKEFGLPFVTSKIDVTALAAVQGDGLEAAARIARYDFLREAAECRGARFVVTAHTADDQVETVLQRILRGTGIAGLAGIPHSRPLSPSVTLVRPMLSVRLSKVIEYLKELGQKFREDASNRDARFTRNRLRHELLPLIRERFNGNVDGALLRLTTQAAEAQTVIGALRVVECVVIEHQDRGGSRPALCVRIDCSRLVGLAAIVVREVCKLAWRDANWPLQAMGFDEWQMLAGMSSGSCSRAAANLPGNVRVHRDGARLVLEADGLG